MNNAKPTAYFFADPNTFSQDGWAAFGPRGDNAEQKANQFSLSSVFGTWSGTTTNAYAICKGVVFLQPQTDNEQTRVNLVLRPLEQPFPGLKVRYFVYRGLRRGDFFTGNKVLAPQENVTSDFINKINAGFASFYTSRNQPVPDFLAKYIGFDPENQAGNLLLDDFFFKQNTYTGTGTEDATKSFELPVVQGGASLGRFLSGDTFGIDVVLDYGDFREPSDDTKFVFDLSYIRAWRAELNFWWLNDPNLKHKRKQHKEQVLQFIDVLAFYGAYASGNGILKAKGGDNNWYVKVPGDIYSDLIGTSFGKNRWYFYIQSDRTRSYNFYGNYVISDTESSSLKKGYAENAMSETTYTADDWPIMIDEGSQSHGENTNNLFLQFTKTAHNPNAMLYVQVGQLANAQHNNFCDADNLSLPDEQDGTASIWTKPLHFKVPAVSDGSNKRNVASFSILLYQGRDYAYQSGMEPDENDVYQPVYSLPNYFDEVFDGLDAVPLLSQQGNPIYTVLSNQKLKLVSQYYNQTHYGIAAVQTSRITDAIATDNTSEPLLKRVTYIAESVDTLSNAIAIGGKLNTGAGMSASAFSSAKDNNTYQLPDPFYYERQLFSDSTETITGLKLKTNKGSLPDRIMVGMTETEHNALKELILTNGVRNARLFLIDLFEDGNELISVEGTTYQKYRLGIVAEEWNGNVKLFTPTEDIMVYAIDRYYYHTEEYSKYVKEYINNDYTITMKI